MTDWDRLVNRHHNCPNLPELRETALRSHAADQRHSYRIGLPPRCAHRPGPYLQLSIDTAALHRLRRGIARHSSACPDIHRIFRPARHRHKPRSSHLGHPGHRLQQRGVSGGDHPRWHPIHTDRSDGGGQGDRHDSVPGHEKGHPPAVFPTYHPVHDQRVHHPHQGLLPRSASSG